MSAVDWTGTFPKTLHASDTLRLAFSFAALYVLYRTSNTIYDAFFGPLSKFPGPRIRALSCIPQMIVTYKGTGTAVHIALHDQYGPVVRIAPNELEYASGAQAWKDIDGFKRPDQPIISKDESMYMRPFNNTEALVTADDILHSRQRKLVSHAFADKSMRELEPILRQWCATMVEKLSERAKAGEKVDMLKFFNCTTFDIMSDLSFAEPLQMLEKGEYSSWVKAVFLGIKSVAVLRIIKYMGAVGHWFVDGFLMNTPQVRAMQAEHWNFSKERVERRLAKTPDRPDLWTKLLEKRAGSDGLSHDEHLSMASLFMIAGTETIATALSGTLYWLLQNPECLTLLTQEVRDAHSSYEDVTLDSVARLEYLQAVLREGLRMYPPVPTALPRKVPKGGAVVCGEFVPAGTRIGINQFSTYRRKELFKNPYEFHPERWLEDAEYADDHLDAVEPFTVGPRNCVGKSLAWHEMRLILASTVWHFDLDVCSESDGWHDQKVCEWLCDLNGTVRHKTLTVRDRYSVGEEAVVLQAEAGHEMRR